MKATMKILALFGLSIALVYMGWGKWLATNPQPLPSKSIVNDDQNYGFPQGTYTEISLPFMATTASNRSAEYRLWIPTGVKTLRGLIVRQHGCGDPAAATGLDHANDLHWQALAIKHQFAILGTKLPAGYPLCIEAAITNRVTENAFLLALQTLATKTDRPELVRVPWALWGHSGGADWGMQMLLYYPERVIAVVNMRSGGIVGASGSEILNLDPQSASALLKTPVLWAIGEKDPYVEECITIPKKIFAKFRAANANWTLAIEPNTTHESGNNRFLAIPYLDAIISARLASDSDSPEERLRQRLQPIRSAQGWLGNTRTHTVAAIANYPENPLAAAWLPNEELAHKWQALNTGQVAPTHKPSAPVAVRALRHPETGTVITWNFTPDLENGLPSFRIYRDKSLIATLKGQNHNFGDAPDPANVVLEFVDRSALTNSTYTVAAFNALGENISLSTPLVEKK
jgi:hypothetical protein